jgi:hypothetical protein
VSSTKSTMPPNVVPRGVARCSHWLQALHAALEADPSSAAAEDGPVSSSAADQVTLFLKRFSLHRGPHSEAHCQRLFDELETLLCQSEPAALLRRPKLAFKASSLVAVESEVL